MSGRPAVIRQRDSKQIINAAKKAGAKRVEFRIGNVPVIVHLRELHGQRMSLRKISAALASQGHLTARGKPYVASAVQAMVG
jgi:glutamine phosphoribosylpyrophosphate amidotransferase